MSAMWSVRVSIPQKKHARSVDSRVLLGRVGGRNYEVEGQLKLTDHVRTLTCGWQSRIEAGDLLQNFDL